MQTEKIRTTVRIAGKDYVITSYDSAEHVARVAANVDRKLNELQLATRLPASQLAVLVAVNATDDMLKSRDEIDRLRREIEELQTQVETLREQLSAAQAEVDAGCETVTRLNDALGTRDGEIARLRAAINANG